MTPPLGISMFPNNPDDIFQQRLRWIIFYTQEHGKDWLFNLASHEANCVIKKAKESPTLLRKMGYKTLEELISFEQRRCQNLRSH